MPVFRQPRGCPGTDYQTAADGSIGLPQFSIEFCGAGFQPAWKMQVGNLLHKTQLFFMMYSTASP